jgi:hypothetical protein
MTLTVALAILGGLVLAAIIAHGAWQQRRANPRRPEPDPPFVRREPTLGDETPKPVTEVIGTLPAGAADTSRADPLPMPALLRRTVRLDASIDAIVPITIEAPVTGEHALMHLPTARRAGSKPFYVEGLNAASGEWETPSTGQRYGEFQAGVQLASRNGPLNEIEYSEFIQKVQGFAEPMGGMVDAPDMLAVVARARELDGFAQASDAVLTAELRARGAAWSTGFVEQCAARHGFVKGSLPGRLALPSPVDPNDPPMLALSYDPQAALADDPTQAVVRSATLTLDVPQSPETAEPFAAWHRAATELAREMEADLVDDRGAPIPVQSFASIGETLAGLYRRMAARDIAAGSAAARRLFS